MTTQMVSSIHSENGLCHISDKTEKANGYYYYRTRCGKRLRNPWVGFYSENQCPQCGNTGDYQAIMDALREWQAAQKLQHEQGRVRNQARLALRNEQRRRLAPEIQQALEQIGAQQVELEYQLHGAKLAGNFSVDGQEHRFSMVLKR